MAAREFFSAFLGASRRNVSQSICSNCRQSLRYASTSQPRSEAASEPAALEDLEESSFVSQPSPSPELVSSFDPVKRAADRKQQLVPSRYQFRPPKYDRGPLHPHQSPPVTDPASREYVPGPFTSPRLAQTYHSTIAPDLMTMTYVHRPPGFQLPAKGQRLRAWDGSSPYHKNRPLRGPRGGDTLRLLRDPITFRNIPELKKITVHFYIQGANRSGESSYLHVAGMIIQAITNVPGTVHKARVSEMKWGLVRQKTNVAMTSEITGEDMYHFMSKLVDVVLPRIKDWQGVRATTGDGSGNLTFGLDPESIGAFPEVEINYDSYPPKMIPGAHITIHTSASTDRDARLLLASMGVPFYGKIKN